MNSIDLDDDLILFTTDDLEYHSPETSDLSTNSNVSSQSIQTINKKMSDITELLDSTDFHDNSELISANIMDYLCTHNIQNEQNNYEKFRWENEEKCLKYESKQLSPNDYVTRTSLYNRPVAFEKDSRSWARSLLDNFKKSNQNFQVTSSSSSSSTSFPSYFPIGKKSSSFDHHVQYIEHLNECNDYPAYLEYLRENRSQLFCTLTDSVDVIDGLLGTIVSSF